MRLRDRSGLLAGILKLVLYGVVLFLAVSVAAPGVVENPSLAVARVQQLAVSESTDPDSIDRYTLEQRIHQQVNYRRAEHNLQALSYDTELAAIARSYSEDMATRGFFSHYSPDGADFADRYEDAGYECSIQSGNKIYQGGENLARNHVGKPVQTEDGRDVYTTEDELAQAIVTGWMHSPDHRDNMLKPVWEQEGIGASIRDDGTVYVTQNFC
jgi:uncharacterized protein YkwD